uniref:Uncharacterized protein n=1 Tax=Neovison vison TaxID=452646 RepID=A0A8C7A5B7_NEOVI
MEVNLIPLTPTESWKQTLSEPSNPSSSSNSGKRDPVRKRVLQEGGGEKILNRRGRSRMGTQDDGEDENNSWNGNSNRCSMPLVQVVD